MNNYLKALVLTATSIVGGFPLSADVSSEVRQNHILFSSGGTELDEDALTQIVLLGQILELPPLENACLKLVGYSDASGGQSVNRSISQTRAETVARALSAVLEDPGRIVETLGVGAADFLEELPKTDKHQRRVAIMARTCG